MALVDGSSINGIQIKSRQVQFLEDIHYSNSDFSNIKFDNGGNCPKEASFKNLTFDGCTFNDCIFETDWKVVKCNNCWFTNCVFRNITLTCVEVFGSVFDTCEWIACKVFNQTFKGCEFTKKAIMDGLKVESLILDNCKIDELNGTSNNFSDLLCVKSKINKWKQEYLCFSNCVVKFVTIISCKLSNSLVSDGLQISNSHMDECKLKSCDVKNLRLLDSTVGKLIIAKSKLFFCEIAQVEVNTLNFHRSKTRQMTIVRGKAKAITLNGSTLDEVECGSIMYETLEDKDCWYRNCKIVDVPIILKLNFVETCLTELKDQCKQIRIQFYQDKHDLRDNVEPYSSTILDIRDATTCTKFDVDSNVASKAKLLILRSVESNHGWFMPNSNISTLVFDCVESIELGYVTFVRSQEYDNTYELSAQKSNKTIKKSQSCSTLKNVQLSKHVH